MRKTHKISLVLFYGILVLVVAGCASIERYLEWLAPTEVFYKPSYQSLKIMRAAYKSEDTVAATYFIMCAKKGKDRSSKTLEDLSFNEVAITNSLSQAIKKTGETIRVAPKYKMVDANDLCSYIGTKKYPEKVKELLTNEDQPFAKPDAKGLHLFLFVDYGAYWEYETVIRSPAGVMSTDRKHFRINRGLIAIVLEQDSVAYMDSYYHRDTAFVNPGKELVFEFPQEIMDSLVMLTLKGYTDRLK